MTFTEYFKEAEKELIEVVGESDWLHDKVYTTEEVIKLVEDYNASEGFCPKCNVHKYQTYQHKSYGSAGFNKCNVCKHTWPIKQ